MQRLVLTDNWDHETLRGVIDEHHSSHPDPAVQASLQFFDTFDWRLYRKGLLLDRTERLYRLYRLDDPSWPLATCDRFPLRRGFWDEFPLGPLRDSLALVLDVRALIHLVSVDSSVQPLQILDPEGKTVLQIGLETMSAHGRRNDPVVFRSLTLQPVEGCHREHEQFQEFLAGLDITDRLDNLLEPALQAVGIKPAGYSAKLNFQLDPGLTTLDATRIILRHLLRVIKINEPGIRADIDPEFLHHHRVAVRRTRSALTQIKNVFPRDVTAAFKHDFADLSNLSNRLRDLDVYLLKRDEYTAMLPATLRPGLEPLFARIATQRSEEHTRYLARIASENYREVLQRWQAWLDRTDERSRGRDAAVPVKATAYKIIRRRYRKVLGRGSKITDSSSVAALHALRIDCKKLRYLLEFFSSLFPAQAMQRLVEQLKRLQDNLGDFNDLSVQQGDLRHGLKDLQNNRQNHALEAAALGGLIAMLRVRQLGVREEYQEAFAGFAGPETRQVFRELFDPGQEE